MVSKIPALIPDFKGNYLFIIQYAICYRILMNSFYQVKEIHFYFYFTESFYNERKKSFIR